MKSRFRLLLVVAWLLALAPLAALGEEGGWKLPNLNPFSRQGKPPTSARVRDSGDAWKLPKLWPPATAVKPNAKQPGAWQRMTSGTRSFFSKTADALNPFDDANDQKQPVRATGSNSAFRRASVKKEEKGGSLLPASWWGGEEKKEPRTVQDFLAQPRPSF